MVGTENIVENGGGCNLILDPVRYDKIVDAPACVVLPGIEPVAPPAVNAGGIGI